MWPRDTARRSSAARSARRYALGGENAAQRRVFEIVRRAHRPRRRPRIPFPVATMLGAVEELRVCDLRRHAAHHARRGRDLPPRLVARQQRGAVRDLGYTMTPLADGVANDCLDSPARFSGGREHCEPAFRERAAVGPHRMRAFALLLRYSRGRRPRLLASSRCSSTCCSCRASAAASIIARRRRARLPLGHSLYPLSVLLLMLVFPSRLDIVAAAWAILAFGDGAATLVGMPAAGQESAGRRLPVEPEKTGGRHDRLHRLGGACRRRARVVGAARRSTPPPPRSRVWAPVRRPLAALRRDDSGRLDDNLSVPSRRRRALGRAA